MAKRCAMQQTAFSDAAQRRVICPRPRRIYPPPSSLSGRRRTRTPNLLTISLLRFSRRFVFTSQSDQVPSFFCGSPPTRYDNPVVHDARFGDAVPIEPVPVDPAFNGSGSRSGCARVRYGLTPAAVRIEGFDCLDRDRSRSRGIPAVA
ncbi:hypothetical protein HPP92_027123 [Vanilla planifolia]|uniref:Uncharacterized protein n=1 Tax=Vanilla planifolia TaxID=51239 RepID=A0A835PEE6_VANPL|nr:hypothetical protein HPP92_027123 [Vanilla planifolia]